MKTLNKRNKTNLAITRFSMLFFIAAIALAAILVTGCKDGTGVELSEAEKQLDELRVATESFKNVEIAKRAGWDAYFPPFCMTHIDLGGMGVHQFNADLVDNEVILTKPELLVYEVQADGSLRYIAVEYMIPYKILPRDAEPPRLFDREFMQNDFFHVWALHVWLIDNPNGTFASFNPQISCANADKTVTFPQPGGMKMHH